LSQKNNNAQLLYFIKTQLGYGNISKPKDGNWSLRIRDCKHLEKIIIPIFDQFSLITRKQYDYIIFKKALNVLTNNILDNSTKNKLMQELWVMLKNGPDQNYVSPVWSNPDFHLSKPWIIGFFEAEGSLYIVKKGDNRYSHGFGITQKEDRQILEQLCSIFHCSSKVIYNKKGFFSLDSTGHRANLNLVNYFYNEGKNCFIGIKSLQFTIWRRTLKFRGNLIKLNRIRNKLINLII
jgi:hypothetical protein